MRGAHKVKSEFIFKKICVVLLCGFRHCITDIRVCLVPVKTADFNLFSVKEQAILCEYSLSEAETLGNRVAVVKSYTKKIQLRAV